MDSKSKTKRIDELIEKIKQVAGGDYSTRIEFSGKNDELDILALNLNTMIEGIGQHIAEFDRTTKDLKKSEERYRKQIEEAMDAIIIADAETGIIVDCNRMAEVLVGRKKSELIGQPQWILHPPQEIDNKFSKTFMQHRGEKDGEVLENQVITKDGEIKDVAIKANVFELNGRKLMQGIFRDITEYRKLVTELEREKVLMDAMMNNFPEYIYFKDLNSQFLRISRVLATEVFNLSDPKKAIGKSDFDFFPPEHAQKDYAEEQEIIKSGKPVVNHEVKTEWADGSVSWASITKLPLRDEHGQIIGTFGISRNITTRRLALQEVEKMRDLLKDLNQQLAAAYEESRHQKDELLALLHDAQSALLLDSTGQILGVTEKMTRLTGFSRLGLIGKNIKDLVEPNSRLQMDNMFKVSSIGGFKNIYTEFVKPDGGFKKFDLGLNRVNLDKEKMFIAIIWEK